MLVIIRIQLHSLYIIVCIRETNVALFTTMSQRQVISLIETCTEDVSPLVTINRHECTFSTVEVSNLLVRVISSTPRIVSFTVRSSNSIAIAVQSSLTETGQSCLVCIAQYPVVITRTVFLLNFRHVGHLIPAHVSAEVNAGTATLLTLLGSNHHNTIGSFRTIQSRCGSTLQDRDVFNIFRVDIHETVRVDTLVPPIVIIVSITVTQRHTVHDQQRLSVTCNRRKATYRNRYG